jgi:hypothetical protein
MKNENCEKRSGWKPLEPAGRMPDLLRLFLPFCILHFAFCICLGQTRSALMVTNETGRLAGPTNFFAANSNLLNQAVNTNGFGGGGGAAFGGNPHWFFTNGAGQIDLQLSLSNFFNALQIGSVNLTNWSALATNVLQTEISAATNGLNVGQYLAANGGAGNANTLTNPAVQGGLYFPIGGFDWIGEAMGNVFDLLDTNGNIALQITNNHQGANLYADLTIANNLFLAGNNPGIWNHGTAQWQGSLNIVGALSGNGSALTFPSLSMDLTSMGPSIHPTASWLSMAIRPRSGFPVIGWTKDGLPIWAQFSNMASTAQLWLRPRRLLKATGLRPTAILRPEATSFFCSKAWRMTWRATLWPRSPPSPTCWSKSFPAMPCLSSIPSCRAQILTLRPLKPLSGKSTITSGMNR